MRLFVKALFGCFALAIALPVYAADRVASLAQIPDLAADNKHGILIDLIQAMDRVTNSTTDIVVQPFSRSLNEAATGAADFQLPFLQNPDKPEPPPPNLIYLDDVTVWTVPLVIYSRKDAPLDAKSVIGKNVEVPPDREHFFPWPVNHTNCTECSLKKVAAGRLDAVIVAVGVGDPLLKEPELKDIHRALYRQFEIRAVLPANKDTTATQAYLREGLKKLKESGEYQKIMATLIKPYDDWQP